MKDLTVGSPTKVLWAFTLPMFLSVVFQQLYSIADSAIAGQFAGEDALAAIGASYPITMIFMAVAVGSNVGCAVVISQYFGAKNYMRVKLCEPRNEPVILIGTFKKVWPKHVTFTTIRPYIKGIQTITICTKLSNAHQHIYVDNIIFVHVSGFFCMTYHVGSWT